MARCIALAASLQLLTAAAASAQAAPTAVRLMWCAPRSTVVCMRGRVELTPLELQQGFGGDTLAEPGQWHALLADAPLIGPSVNLEAPAPGAVRLLLLVDRSSRMSAERLAFARAAIRELLGTLDSNTRVNVGGFGGLPGSVLAISGDFRKPIAAITPTAAIAPLAGASPDDAAAAIDSGRAILGRRQAAAGTRAVLVLITTRFDRQLAALSRGTTASPVAVDVITIDDGKGSAAHREQVGGISIVSVADDPNAVADQLRFIGEQLHRARSLTFISPGMAVGSLGRFPGAGTLRWTLPDGPELARVVAIRPPLIGLPSVMGVVPAEALTAGMHEELAARESLVVDTRGLTMLLLAAALLAAWYGVPRLAWPESRFEAAATVHASSVTAITAPHAASDAAPRLPEDITKQTARRTAMQR